MISHSLHAGRDRGRFPTRRPALQEDLRSLLGCRPERDKTKNEDKWQMCVKTMLLWYWMITTFILNLKIRCWPHACRADSVFLSHQTASPNPDILGSPREEDGWCRWGLRCFGWSDASLRPSVPPVRPCRSPADRSGTDRAQEPAWRNPPSGAAVSCCSYSTAAADLQQTDTAYSRERAQNKKGYISLILPLTNVKVLMWSLSYVT